MTKTKLIAVWHVEYCLGGEPCVVVATSYEEATLLKRDSASLLATCVTITGPHQHRVSA